MKHKITMFFKRHWRHLCSFWQSVRDIPSRVRGFFHKEKPLRTDFTPEMEDIMNKLLRSTVGTGGALDREFMLQTAQYDKKHPIGETEARELMSSLLKLAIANRDKLNGRIEHSVEFGWLYFRYYSKLKSIYDLTVKTNEKREEMMLAQQEYFAAYNVYKNVYEMTYTPTVTKVNTTPAYDPPPEAAPPNGG